jgi:UDP-N-acetylmuramate dehydrogenase
MHAAGEELRRMLGERARFGEPLSRHTSFRIGGPADVWVEVADASEVRRVQQYAAATDQRLWILGGGTNVLVSDRGVRGVVLHLGKTLSGFEWVANGNGLHVRAGAAAVFKKLVNESVTRHLAGLEFAEGIPGSVGGGLLMNAGAFGGEIAAVVEYVEGVDRRGEVCRLPREALRFRYRHAEVPAGFVVTHVGFLLQRGDAAAIQARRDDARRRRGVRQPLGYPNAGSIFKNPPGKFAGRLIEEAGLKGYGRGGAKFSEHHANFIVNVGGATAADVVSLMEEAARRVFERTGITLEREIKLVGDWSRA